MEQPQFLLKIIPKNLSFHVQTSKERSAVGREIFAEESRPSSESDGRYFKKFATCINTSSHTKHTACYHSLSGYYLSVYHLRCVLFTVKQGFF